MLTCCWCQDPCLRSDLVVPAEAGFHGPLHADCWECWSLAYYPAADRLVWREYLASLELDTEATRVVGFRRRPS